MRTLIIIEDEKIIRDGLKEMIPWEEMEFSVEETFKGGFEAIEWLKVNHVDLVLTDIMMANGSGLDIAKFLNRENRKEVIIFLTAYKDFEFAQQGIKYGIKYYLTKDMGYKELISAFKEVERDLNAKEIEKYIGIGIDEKEDMADMVRVLIDHLNHHYRTTTLAQAADAVKMSPTYLSTFIKKQLQTNFKVILTKIRMEKAIELLANPILKINEISKMVGYTDCRSFLRNFRNEYGVTPGEYRKIEHIRKRS